MKKKLILPGLMLLLPFLFCGCGTVSFVKRIFVAPPSIMQDVQKLPTMSPSKSNAATSPTSSVQNSTLPAQTISEPTSQTVGETIHREVALMWIAAFLLALGAGACAYFQNWLCAVKLGLGAIALPICATFLSLYWGWIIAGSLVALAAYVFIHYKAVVLPAAEAAAENALSTLKKI